MPKRLRIPPDAPAAKPPVPVDTEKDRARLIKLFPQLSSELLARGLKEVAKAGSASVVAALVAAFPPAPVDLAKCAVCREMFDKNLNFKSVCESKEHVFNNEYDRGECPGCEEWDACCRYCSRCQATECEEDGVIELPKGATTQHCYEGVHVTKLPSYFDSTWPEPEGDSEDGSELEGGGDEPDVDEEGEP